MPAASAAGPQLSVESPKGAGLTGGPVLKAKVSETKLGHALTLVKGLAGCRGRSGLVFLGLQT